MDLLPRLAPALSACLALPTRLPHTLVRLPSHLPGLISVRARSCVSSLLPTPCRPCPCPLCPCPPCLQHISEVSDCIGRSVLLGGRHALRWSSHALTAASDAGADTCVQRIWRERVSPPLYIAGQALAPYSAPLAGTLAAGGRALVAAADTAVVARGLMYTSVRQASADLASVVLGPQAAPVVAEGMDTIVAAQATVSWVACSGVGWLIQAGGQGSSASLANNLLYVGIRRGTSESVARRFGPAAEGLVTEGLAAAEAAMAGGFSTASQLPLSSVGWAMQAVNATPQRRILATEVRHPTTPPKPTAATAEADGGETTAVTAGGEGCAADEDDETDAWILLGAPWLEGFVAVRGPLCPTSTNTSTNSSANSSARSASAASSSLGPWRRVWCVLQDSAIAFFEHEQVSVSPSHFLPSCSLLPPPATSLAPAIPFRFLLTTSHCSFSPQRQAAANITAQPIATCEWLDLRTLRLCADPAPPSSSAFASAGHAFELTLADGRRLLLRADTATQRALWARELLRLASWRAVHLLQLELTSHWHAVEVDDTASAVGTATAASTAADTVPASSTSSAASAAASSTASSSASSVAAPILSG